MTHAFARYASGFITELGTSIPGVGFQLGTAYYTACGAAYSAGPNVIGKIFAVGLNWGAQTKLVSWGLDKAGIWDNYNQIGGFQPYTIYGR